MFTIGFIVGKSWPKIKAWFKSKDKTTIYNLR